MQVAERRERFCVCSANKIHARNCNEIANEMLRNRLLCLLCRFLRSQPGLLSRQYSISSSPFQTLQPATGDVPSTLALLEYVSTFQRSRSDHADHTGPKICEVWRKKMRDHAEERRGQLAKIERHR